MKGTHGFDARRLRPRQQRSWRARIGAALGLLLIILGLLLAGSGAATLFSHQVLAGMALDREAAATLLALGLVMIVLGMLMRRRVRRRLREPNGLSISPDLKKKR